MPVRVGVPLNRIPPLTRENLCQWVLWTIGGNHTRQVLQQLHDMHPEDER